MVIIWVVKIFFCTVLLCILATSYSYLLLLLGPYHFCPLLSPSLHGMYLGIFNFHPCFHFLHLWMCLFSISFLSGIIQYLSSHVWLFLNNMFFSHSVMSNSAIPWTAVCQDSLPFTISQTLFKLIYTQLEMPSNSPILCHPLLLLPSIFTSIRIFFPMS